MHKTAEAVGLGKILQVGLLLEFLRVVRWDEVGLVLHQETGDIGIIFALGVILDNLLPLEGLI